MTTVENFDMAAIDPIMFGSEEFSDDTTDFIRKAMEESAIPYEDDLFNILTDADSIQTSRGTQQALSDTSSDSGCNFEQQLLSPEPCSSSANSNGLDLLRYMQEDDEEYETPVHVNPRTNSPEYDSEEIITTLPSSFETGATTIILPVISPKTVKVVKSSPAPKRRRVSASSNDSGVEENNSVATVKPTKKGKYPPLELSEEEKRICEREGIKLPSHYPLSREEERNLKKIRRKIRNKLSAQDSRKRKKEYMDNMEDRVKACTDENEDLHKRIEQLETQNKTLAGQLKRLHQIILSGGFTTRANQTSTAMMVLLLSTALFLIPGLRENRESQKSEIDITRAIKMPPMPGQSRSLLQFNPNIKEEFNVNDNTVDKKVPALDNIKQESMNGIDASSPFHDHDYFIVGNSYGPTPAKQKKTSYIEADVPTQGYGFAEDTKDGILMKNNNNNKDSDVYVLVENEGESRLNVNVTGTGTTTRTVVLHVPKDMK